MAESASHSYPAIQDLARALIAPAFVFIGCLALTFATPVVTQERALYDAVKTDNVVWMAITDFSNPLFALATLFAAGVFAFVRRRPRVGVFAILVALGTWASVTGIKLIVARPRPIVAKSFSFPSGHAACSMAVALALCVIVYEMRDRKALHRKWWVLAICYAALVGASRVALGWHWPTDVLAGFALAVSIVIASRGIALGSTTLPIDPDPDPASTTPALAEKKP